MEPILAAKPFIPILVALFACAISLWFGRISRDKEVQRARENAEFFLAEANTWKQRAIERLDQVSRWKTLALDSQQKLTSLPVRGPGGKFVKQK